MKSCLEEPPFGCFSPTFAHIPPEGTKENKTPLWLPKFSLFAIPRAPALLNGINSQLQVDPDCKELSIILTPTFPTPGFLHPKSPGKSLEQRAGLCGAQIPAEGRTSPWMSTGAAPLPCIPGNGFGFLFQSFASSKTRTFPVFSSRCNQEMAKLALS